MPSWVEPAAVRAQVADVGHLLRFRTATLRRPRLAAAGLGLMVLMTVIVVVVPVHLVDRVDPRHLRLVEDQLGAALVGLVALMAGSAIAIAGGRELLARDPAAIHPIGPVTDHLGALLLAPLSAAWLLPVWTLLGAVALTTADEPPARRLAAVLLTLLWVVLATAVGQVAAWSVEWVRRGRYGSGAVRVAVLVALGGLAALLLGGGSPLLAASGDAVADAIRGEGPAGPVALVLGVGVVLCVGVGVVPAAAAARRPARDEARVETSVHRSRPDAVSDLAALSRIDRASVWRSVPLRRGVYVLAVGPGLFAFAAAMTWQGMTVLPGLVASGCVLLFGVNVWCLDGRGLLWRETLPVAPTVVFDARALVLAELLLGAGVVTVVLGGLRAGLPTPLQLLTTLLVLVVVTGQAVSAGMRWSAASPYAVDLRSARATPAPPLAMVGYSVRLAFSTTLTALLLAGLGATGRPLWLIVPAAVLLAVSATRIRRSRLRWSDPVQRAQVVATVAA